MKILLRGPVKMADGYGKALVNLARGLIQEGVDLTIHPTEQVNPTEVPTEVLHAVSYAYDRVNSVKKYDLGVLFSLPDLSIVRTMYAERWVVYSMYEFPQLPAHWKPALNAADLCIVPTSVCKEIWHRHTSTPTKVVPLGYDPQLYFPEKIPGPRNCRFVCYGMLQARKSPLLAVEAYCDAVSTASSRAFSSELMVKSVKRMPVSVERSALPWGVEFINEDWSESDTAKLVRTSDALIYPTRSEGFGMPLLEAAACGLVVIAPNIHPKNQFPSPTIPVAYFGKENMVSLLGNQGEQPQVSYASLKWGISTAMDCWNKESGCFGAFGDARRTMAEWVKEEFNYRTVAKKFLNAVKGA